MPYSFNQSLMKLVISVMTAGGFSVGNWISWPQNLSRDLDSRCIWFNPLSRIRDLSAVLAFFDKFQRAEFWMTYICQNTFVLIVHSLADTTKGHFNTGVIVTRHIVLHCVAKPESEVLRRFLKPHVTIPGVSLGILALGGL